MPHIELENTADHLCVQLGQPHCEHRRDERVMRNRHIVNMLTHLIKHAPVACLT